jgi:hypothetical protein
MRFRGTVFSVHDDGSLFITSESNLGEDRVFAYFDDEEFKKAAILLKDKKITVQGELVGADTFNVALRHCKILERPKFRQAGRTSSTSKSK